MFRITHHRAKCIGCFACVEVAPDRWRINRQDGKSVLIEGKEKKGFFSTKVSDDELEENKQAAANCPVNIIKID